MGVGIVGLGLIGGSIAYDLAAMGTPALWGLSRSLQTCGQAQELGVVTTAATEPQALTHWHETTLIIIATPLDQIVPSLARLLPFLDPQTVITDVGSVKAPIVAEALTLWSRFVGSHPMAGTHESGFAAARPGMFAHAPCVVTGDRAPAEAVELVERFWRSLNMDLVVCSPDAHDQAVAWISHLPVFVSAGLLLSCLREPNAVVQNLSKHLASSGFRDTSRVGGGNPELGCLIAAYNRAALLRSLDAYAEVIQELRGAIARGDQSQILESLQTTQQQRSRYCSPPLR
ncbi:MAG: prephenate/arogenate dehydrogenase [Oscillatoriales cyanobacterium SM2_2_1]|nr:prephenate/arogenate dehydrogenase [Oscillatoriales cyanobacterium SM2_2_1]